MKRISVLMAILTVGFIIPDILYAQKEKEIEFVQRQITEEVVWEGEVHVKDDIIVRKGGRLIIKEGTKVYFHNIGGINVNEGIVQARGRMGKEIVFENTKEAKEKGFMFRGIKLIRVDPNQSYITGCIFKGAANGIVCVLTSLKIENNVFENCISAIELYQESNAKIEHNLIKGCDNGIKAQTKSSPTITGNYIKDIRIFGIQVIQSSKPVITKNTIKQVKKSAIFTTQGVAATITNNTINASNYGIHSYQVGPEQRVFGNHITECRRAIFNDGFSTPIISNNYLASNIVSIVNIQFSSPQIVNNDIIGNYQGIVSVRKCSPIIKDNNIIDNDEGFFIDYSAYPIIKNNNIYDNVYSIRIGDFQSSDWEKKGAGSSKLITQEAARKGSRVDFSRMPKQKITDYVDASKNYWGEDGVAELKKGDENANLSFFYDYFDRNTIVYEGWGDDEYKIDRVEYGGWLTSEIKNIGLKVDVKGDIGDNPKDITVR
jgi:parallel beta-helix repeat protein